MTDRTPDPILSSTPIRLDFSRLANRSLLPGFELGVIIERRADGSLACYAIDPPPPPKPRLDQVGGACSITAGS